MIWSLAGQTLLTHIRSPVMVGRDRELARLEAAMLAALRGESRVAIVSGDAGAGKSRLVAELMRRAAMLHLPALHGECSDSEMSLPYLPLVEAIGRHLDADAERTRVRTALGEELAPVARLIPQLHAGERFDTTGTALDTLRLFESFVSLLRALASPGGLLLVVEDLHWADQATLELLDHVTRRLQGAGTVLLLTVRESDVERGHPLRQPLQRWRRAGADSIRIQPLSVDDVAGMAAAIFGVDGTPGTVARELHERSDGLPFAVEELLRQAVEQGSIGDVALAGWERATLAQLPPPSTLSESILVRSARLDHEQLEVLRCAAVLGRSFEFPALEHMSGQTAEAVVDALDACVDMQLIEEDRLRDNGFRFRHVLVRDAIYNDIIVSRRRLMHARAAEAVRITRPDEPAELAHHLFAAGRAEEAARACADAAEVAVRRLAPREAMDLFGRALAHSTDALDRARLRCLLGEAAHQAGEIAAAQAHLETGVAALEEIGETLAAARHRITLGRCCWLRSQYADASRHYGQARAVLEQAGASEALAVAYIRLAGLHAFELEPEPAEQLARRAMQVADACDCTEQRLAASEWLGVAMCYAGRLDAGLEQLERSRSAAEARGLHFLESTVITHMLSVLETHGRLVRCQPLIDRMRALPDDPWLSVVLPYYESWIALWSARLGDAAQAARRCIDLATAFGMEGQAAWGRGVLCQVAIELGDLDAAAALVPQHDPTLQRQERLEQGGVRLRYHLAAGDVEAAGSMAAELAAEPWALAGTSLTDTVVDAFLAGGRSDDARSLVEGISASARAAMHRGHLLRARGRVALAERDRDVAVALLRAAADAFSSGGYLLEVMRSAPLLAAAEALSGDTASAQQLLQGALRDAASAGAGQITRAAMALADGIGVDVDVVPPMPALSLQAAEAPGRSDTPAPEIRTLGERLVTVVFAGVRQSAAGDEPAPLELAERLAALRRWAALAVEQHGGVVQEVGGDRVMAAFNATGSRVDHTRDALDAAVELVRSTTRLGLAVGAGIAVGPAVVGRVGGGQGLTVTGAAAELASRLEAHAAAGEVVLSDDARTRVRDAHTEGTGGLEPAMLVMPGAAEAVNAFRLRIDDGAAPQSRAAPVTPAPSVNRIVREGEFWSLTYQGKVVRLKDAKGLHDLARLIGTPGSDIAAIDLAGVATPAVHARERAAAGLELGVEGDAGEVLDERARAEYRQRLVDLESEIAEAEDANDPERVSRLRQERSFLIDELGAAVGLMGRSRRTLDPAERARKAVTWRLRDAIARIAAAHPDLGRHLRRSVRTGAFCAYDPDTPTHWSTRA